MSFILAIMLYLSALNTTDYYTQSEVDAIASANQSTTDLISQDPTLSAQIISEYGGQVELIHIVNEGPNH